MFYKNYSYVVLLIKTIERINSLNFNLIEIHGRVCNLKKEKGGKYSFEVLSNILLLTNYVR